MVRLPDIALARYRIAPYLQPTPLERTPELGEQIYLKLENANKTHSFKIRGALNAVLSLSAAERERGIIAVSSGNHAQAVAYAASVAGIPARILMPKHTPRKKVSGVQRYGADAILYGDNYDETELEGRRRSVSEGATFISPYNDPDVVAGAGTIALEVVDALPQVERVLVCVSGGGLISGVALAIKALRPHCEVIGVCAQSAPAMYNFLYGTTYPENWDTLAEALSGGKGVRLFLGRWSALWCSHGGRKAVHSGYPWRHG